MNFRSVCLFCTAVQSLPSPTTCPPNSTPTPATITIVKSSSLRSNLFRMAKWPTMPQCHLLLWHNPLVLVWCHSLLKAPLLRAPRVGLPALVLAQAPTSPAALHPPSGHLGVGSLTPAPLWTQGPAQSRSAALLHPSYAVALAITAARAAGKPYICLCRSSLRIFAQHFECGS